MSMVPSSPARDASDAFRQYRSSKSSRIGCFVKGTSISRKRAGWGAASSQFAFGSDAYYTVKGLSRGGASLRTLHAYKAAGFTTWQIFRVATINASELLGLSSETGAIETGRLADIVAAPRDVLIDPSLLDHVSFVMKAGKVVIRRSNLSGLAAMP
jgi:adenine deaminase